MNQEVNVSIISKKTNREKFSVFSLKDILEFIGEEHLVEHMTECDCKPVGETNLIECDCENEWEDYQLKMEVIK